MATPSTGKYLAGRLEESAVEVQALGHDVDTVVDRLYQYDRVENALHLALQVADERTERILVGRLVAGDVWEAAQLERLRARARAMVEEGNRLAGDIGRFLELRGQPQLFPMDRAS